MFCSNCGKQLSDGSNLCPACGTKQKPVPANRKKAGSVIPIKSAVIAAVSVIALLAVLLLSGCGKEQAGLPGQTGLSAESAQKGDKGVLPSPDTFFGGNLARLYDKDDYKTRSDGQLESKGWKLTYKSDTAALEGFKAYAELVGGGDYAVTQAEYWEETGFASKYFRYVFECDGSDDPEESFYQLFENDRPMQGDLLLEIASHGEKGVCYLILHYDPNYFTFIDSGEVYPNTLSDLSGVSTNSSDVPSNSGSVIKTPCPFCNGGNCKKCGGDGLIYSSALDSNNTITCGAAMCNQGKCTNCGGDGWTD